MEKRAKVFFSGRSQAVRLPVELRFQGTEVAIRRDTVTGDVILSEPKNSWKDLLELVDAIPDEERADFLLDRDPSGPPERMF